MQEEKRSPIIAYDDDPINDTVHHPFTAYNQGYDAAMHGYDISHCPYSDTTRKWYWLDGLKNGLAEKAQRKMDPEEPEELESWASETYDFIAMDIELGDNKADTVARIVRRLTGEVENALEPLQVALADAGYMVHMTHGRNKDAWVNCSRPECKAIRDALGEGVARRLS